MHFSVLAAGLLSASVALASPVKGPYGYNPSKCASGIKNPAAVQSAFSSYGIIPTLIPGINPQVNVKVTYDTVGTEKVKLGNELTIPETSLAPTYSFTNEPGYDPSTTTYSFFLIDPDVPNPDAGALRMNYLHWYVSGNSPSCLPNTNADTVTLYESPSPLSTQEHTYTLLVYREPPGYVPDTVTPQVRLGFDINTYAADAGLVLVGGNFFLEGALNTT